MQLWKIRLWKIWYAVNIPIIVLLDSNAVLPASMQYTKSLLHGYIDKFHDFLCANPPAWLKFLTVIELCFQLPVAVYCLIKLLSLSSSNSVKKTLQTVGRLSNLYALNVITTTSFCIWYVWVYGYYPEPATDLVARDLIPLSNPDKLLLSLVYIPYVVIPILLLV